jgi:Tol biopolymer transport system component
VPEASVYRFALLPPEGGVIKSFALSPNGRYLAYVVEEGKEARLWLRPLDESSARPVRGAEGADPLGTPFWSPDSRFIGFFAEGKLKKVSISGTPPEVLADTPFGRGGAWNDRDTIVFAPLNHGPAAQLFQVASSGGEVSRVTSPGDDTHRSPFFLPDGRRFLFSTRKILSGAPNPRSQQRRGYERSVREIRVGSLDSEQTSVLLKADSNAVLIPSANPAYGHLLLTVRENVLLAYPFDAEKAEIVGDPAPLVEGVGIDAPMMRGLFSASTTGSLVYSLNNSLVQKKEILWVDRRGRKIAEAGPPGYYLSPRLSPDGTKVAITGNNLGNNSDFLPLVFLMNLERRVVSLFAPGGNLAWSADGAQIVLMERGNLFLKDVDGARDAQVLLESEGEGRPGFLPSSWSPDGKWVLGLRRPQSALRIGGDPWVLSLDGQPRLTPFFESEYAEGFPEFSPDGRWVAYSSDESGREEVYVTPFPKADRKWLLSSDGGTAPTWGRQGKELLYVSPAGELMAAPVQLGTSTFQAGEPQQLFRVETAGSNPWRTFDVGPDGQRFLVLRSLDETAPSPVHVVVNWFQELREVQIGPH